MGCFKTKILGMPIPIYMMKMDKLSCARKYATSKIPENIDLNVKGNPLDSQNNWKEEKLMEKKFRETDTLDTFVVLHGII